MKDVYILAIESSCDETSMSIIKNGSEEIGSTKRTKNGKAGESKHHARSEHHFCERTAERSV